MRTACAVLAAALACLPAGARPIDSVSVDYATYLQSPVEGYAFLAAAAAADLEGNTVVGGSLPDVFFEGGSPAVAKLNPSGTAVRFGVRLAASGRVTGVAVDAGGNVYAVGQVSSDDFPATPGALQSAPRGGSDAFLVVLDPDGAVRFATRLGGERDDAATGVALAPDGSVVVAGHTTSFDFPVTPGAAQSALAGQDESYVLAQDAFVARLAPDASELRFGTFLGGEAADSASGVAVDGDGRAVVTGSTLSPDFPVSAGAHQEHHGGATDAFVTRLSEDGSAVVSSTYLGGRADDLGYSVAVAPDGAAFVCGLTASPDLPVTPGALQREIADVGTVYPGGDALVARVDASARARFVTYLGGEASDAAAGLTLDAEGNVVVVGATDSAGFPTTGGAWRAESGTGLFKSSNGGRTWARAGAGLPAWARELAVDPADSRRLFAAAPGGVFESSDGGATWRPTALRALYGYDVTFDPADPARVYAGTQEGLFASEDRGATWNRLTGGLPEREPAVFGVAVDPDHPSRLYATTFEGLFTSEDGGATWSARLERLVGEVVDVPGARVYAHEPGYGVRVSRSDGRGWRFLGGYPSSGYTRAFAVDPRDPDRLFVSASKGTYRSEDAGATWEPIRVGPRAARIGAWAFGSGARVFAAGFGLFVSPDGAAWTRADSAPEASFFSRIVVDPGDPRTVYLLGVASTDGFAAVISPDGGTLRYSTLLNGADTDAAYSVAWDAGGSFHVVGVTRSPDFPATNGAYQTKLRDRAGSWGSFAVELRPDGM